MIMMVPVSAIFWIATLSNYSLDLCIFVYVNQFQHHIGIYWLVKFIFILVCCQYILFIKIHKVKGIKNININFTEL